MRRAPSRDTVPSRMDEQTLTLAPESHIRRTLEEVLAPLVAVDGGTIEFVALRGDVVEVAMGASCRGCPGQRETLEGVVLPALRAADARVRDVRVVAR